jgi:hypothetical protein
MPSAAHPSSSGTGNKCAIFVAPIENDFVFRHSTPSVSSLKRIVASEKKKRFGHPVLFFTIYGEIAARQHC